MLNLEDMIVRKQFSPPWERKRKNRLTFDDGFTQLGTNGEFINAKEIKEPVTEPVPKQ
jgi:hypothetical protein